MENKCLLICACSTKRCRFLFTFSRTIPACVIAVLLSWFYRIRTTKNFTRTVVSSISTTAACFFFLNSTAAVFLLCSFHVDDFCFLTFTCFIQKNYRKYPFTTFTAPSRILISITQMFGSRYSFTGQDGYQSHLLASLDQTCLKV